MKIRRSVFLIWLSVLLLAVNAFPVHAEDEEKYYVYDAAGNAAKEEFPDFKSADRFYSSVLEEYGNAILLRNEDVLKMEYGIVEWKRNDACNLLISYESLLQGEEGTINGCYAADAAYTGSSRDGSTVYFVMSGDNGAVSYEDVILHPYETLGVRLSMYSLSGGKLIHDIKTQLSTDYYSYSVVLDIAPSFLNEGTSYYSYDGHFFYEDFHDMIDDYRQKKRVSAVNAEDPYYNYYQYLSHRSKTSYEYPEIEDYFSNVLHIDGRLHSYNDNARDNANDEVNRSQYYGELKSFYEYQDLYGANALMTLSLSISESSYGKSLRSYLQNNLFRHAAYDSDAERYSSRYDSVDASVYSHAKYYISDIYSNVLRTSYNGAFFGNKACGMNVGYASDPYWGEKAASNYYRLDEALGSRDRNAYCLGIITSISRMTVFADEGLSRRRCTLRNTADFSFIILEDTGYSYKVQVDPSFHDDYLYDPEYSVAYVRKDVFDYIFNEDKIKEDEYVTVHFDLDSGKAGQVEVEELKVRKGSYPVLSDPVKEGYLFAGYDKEIEKATEETSYKALYQKIENVRLSGEIPTVIELDGTYDLRGGRLEILLEDGSIREAEITTDMISPIDTSIPGTQEVIITYNGITLSKQIEISEEKKELDEKVRELTERNLASYAQNGTYDPEDILFIKKNLAEVDYTLSFDEIRLLEKMYLKDHSVNIHLTESGRDIAFSGLTMALYDDEERGHRFLEDTWYPIEEEIPEECRERLLDVAGGYGFEVVDAFRLSLKKNYDESGIDKTIVIQVRVEGKSIEKNYSVYHLDHEGNVIKCKTTQTNGYIQFLTDELGDFMILSIDSSNTYDIADQDENINTRNDAYDNHFFYRQGMTLGGLILAGTVISAIYFILEHKRKKLWKDFRSSWLSGDSVPDARRKS